MADKEWRWNGTAWVEYTGGGGSGGTVDPTPTSHVHTIEQVVGLEPRLLEIEAAEFWKHGIQPRVVWTGSVWPSRVSVVPNGYTGAVEYWSPYDATATAPTDRVLNDLWTRKRTA